MIRKDLSVIIIFLKSKHKSFIGVDYPGAVGRLNLKFSQIEEE